MLSNCDNFLFPSDLIYISIRAIEITPNSGYAFVSLYHSLYETDVLNVIAVFAEEKVKPSITLNVLAPYRIAPVLRESICTEVVKALRNSWRWGKKVRTANG